MLIGILWALLAGLMLGLYAIPGKYTKDFREENTWGLFFMLTMFVVPILATLVIMKGVGEIYGTPEVRAILPQMVITSVLSPGNTCAVGGLAGGPEENRLPGSPSPRQRLHGAETNEPPRRPARSVSRTAPRGRAVRDLARPTDSRGRQPPLRQMDGQAWFVLTETAVTPCTASSVTTESDTT